MKKQLLLAVLIMVSAAVVNAQPGGPRRTVAKRVEIIHAKLDSAFKLDATKLTQSDSVFANYYRASDKIREELSSGGQRPDFQAMREKMQGPTDERDKELKVILGDDNFKKWKDEIEPAMRPQRRGPNR